MPFRSNMLKSLFFRDFYTVLMIFLQKTEKMYNFWFFVCIALVPWQIFLLFSKIKHIALIPFFGQNLLKIRFFRLFSWPSSLKIINSIKMTKNLTFTLFSWLILAQNDKKILNNSAAMAIFSVFISNRRPW